MSTRTALWLMLGSVIALVVAAFWGVWFGFPEPDASADKAARLQFHANASTSIMWLAGMALIVSVIGLLRQWLRSRKSGQ